MTLYELRERELRLLVARGKINRELANVQREIQDICEHNWQWAQVAGEGRFCTKCGLIDLCND